MTTPDLTPIARALVTAYCRHMGMSEDVLLGYVERGWTEWLPQAADVLDAARPVVAAEVGERLRELRGEQEPFVFDWSGPFNRALARGHDHSSAAFIADEAEAAGAATVPSRQGRCRMTPETNVASSDHARPAVLRPRPPAGAPAVDLEGLRRTGIADGGPRAGQPGDDRGAAEAPGGQGRGGEGGAAAFLGAPIERGNHPHDPDDLGRCLRLMKLVPEIREGFVERMSALSPEWQALAERWDEIAASMEAEVGIDWSKGRSAPRTYGLMRSILRDAECAA